MTGTIASEQMPAPVNAAGGKPLSITALVLGLVSVVLGFTVLVPIAAIVIGIMGLKRENAKGMAVSGLVLGAVFGVVWVLFSALIILLRMNLAG